jgi:hypothetical protein
MAKTKQDKKLYGKMRDHGIRKSVARELSKLPGHVSKGKQAPKPLRDAVDRLEGLVQELKGHTDSGTRKTAARKAARTRSQNAASRSAAARKAARTRAQGSGGRRSTVSASKSRATSQASKSRSGSTASKPRSGSTASKSRSGSTAAKPRSARSAAKARSAASSSRSGARRSPAKRSS